MCAENRGLECHFLRFFYSKGLQVKGMRTIRMHHHTSNLICLYSRDYVLKKIYLRTGLPASNRSLFVHFLFTVGSS
jgi:hypothetical protein